MCARMCMCVCVCDCATVWVCDIVLIAVCGTLIIFIILPCDKRKQGCAHKFIIFYDDITVCSIFITMVKVRPFCWWWCVCCIVLLTLCIHYFTSLP